MRSRWLTDLSFLAAQALMEVLPLFLLVALVQHSKGELTEVSFAQAWSLQLSAAVLAWSFGRSQRRVLLLMAAAATLLLLGTFAERMPAWVLSSYLCLRGLFMGRSIDSPGAVLPWFRLGAGFCAMFFAFVALSATPRAELPYDQLQSLSIAYLFWGTLLTGLHQRRTTLTSAALTPAALVSVLGPTLLILMCSALLVFGPLAGGAIVRWGAATVSHITSLAARALGLLGSAIVSFLRWFGGLFDPAGGTVAAPRAPVTHGPPGMWEPLVRFREITWRADSSEVMVLLVLLLGALAILHLFASVRRERARTRAASEDAPVHEEQHSTLSWQLLLQPLVRLRRKRRAAPLRAAELSALRTIYRALLSWAALRGQPRAPSTTPNELARQLSAEHPEKREALSELTDYYTKERYAERPCTEAEQARARALLHELRR